MSIYCSRVTAGTDAWGDGKGEVVAYPDNDLRRIGRRDWPEGAIYTAHIPHWCIPGHDEGDGCRGQDDDQPVSRWLRISVKSAGSWLDVLADRDAVEALRDDLSAWLDLDHASARKARKP